MAKYKLLLPKMGESVAEATIIKWLKNPGDYIETDETVIEIATDKVDSEVPSPVSGRLLEQLCKENDVVQVGDVVAIIETEELDEIKDQGISNQLSSAVAEENAPVGDETTVVDEASPIVQEISGEKANEQNEAADEAVKTTDETKSPVFAEQRNEIREQVPYTEQLEQRPASKSENGSKDSARFYSPLVRNIAAQEGIAADELDQIPGTGAEGRLTKDDLLSYIQTRFKPKASQPPVGGAATIETFQPSPVAEPITAPLVETAESVAESDAAQPVVETPAAEVPTAEPRAAAEPEPLKASVENKAESGSSSVSGGDEIIEMDRMRRIIADHMVMSKHTSPHVTSFVEADVTNLVLWREKVKNSFEKREGEKITFTPIFIEAVVKAIRDFPMINISVTGTQIIKKKDINISMATALPSGNLIVPVIKRADELSLLGLTKAVNDLANRARINKLKPDDVQGGTFTITNVGSFGNVMGTPIINQPQVAILAVGAIKKKPAVIETPQGDAIAIRHMMFLSLSYDHRVVDGALGGSFIKRVADYLENWDKNRTI